MPNVKLYKKKSKRAGFELYQDLWLSWKHNGKVYNVRIRPVFLTDFKKLISQAETSNK